MRTVTVLGRAAPATLQLTNSGTPCFRPPTSSRNTSSLFWNQQQFDQLPRLLHPAFQDHSLPAALPPTAAGVQAWVQGTSAAFTHRTVIEAQVTEGEQSMLKIRMPLTHTGDWRGIPATGRTVEAVGYRYFRLENGQIREHWPLLAGNAIENQLREAGHGCKIQA
ncbi:ester cyclase [Hymenobacter terricola]|uniref:ester cyclase n=1 Tax=Hymenobacter terricola TaxID=2819236 RepID=UPI001B300A92|nr:ester cyclase [Hymenobacter terricola]